MAADRLRSEHIEARLARDADERVAINKKGVDFSMQHLRSAALGKTPHILGEGYTTVHLYATEKVCLAKAAELAEALVRNRWTVTRCDISAPSRQRCDYRILPEPLWRREFLGEQDVPSKQFDHCHHVKRPRYC